MKFNNFFNKKLFLLFLIIALEVNSTLVKAKEKYIGTLPAKVK